MNSSRASLPMASAPKTSFVTVSDAALPEEIINSWSFVLMANGFTKLFMAFLAAFTNFSPLLTSVGRTL